MLDGQINRLTITFLEVEWLSIFTVQWNPDFLNHLTLRKANWLKLLADMKKIIGVKLLSRREVRF